MTTTTEQLTLFTVHATFHRWDPNRHRQGFPGGVFVVAARDESDAMELIREFLPISSLDANFGDPDPIGLAAGSDMRPDAIHRGIVISPEL